MVRISADYAKKLGIKVDMDIVNKFRAIPHELDGIFFPSKLHMQFYAHLTLRQRLGEILYFLREVPIRIPVNEGKSRKLVVDFLVFNADGTHHWYEVKSKATETLLFKTKRDIVEFTYPIKIEVIKIGEF